MESPIFFIWQTIQSDITPGGSHKITRRSKVIGGWLVKESWFSSADDSISLAMVFVPDPSHEWKVA